MPVEVRIEGAVARVTLAHPPLNILNITVLGELRQALRALAGQSFKVLLLDSPLKVFSAGADVAEHLPAQAAAMLETFHGALGELLEFPQPTLAAVRGAALGGGAELALACDMMFMTPTATLGQPEIKVGVFPPFAALMLPRLVPPRVAFEMVCSGQPLRAERCLELGLANAVYAAETFDEELARSLDALTRLSGDVLRVTRKALRLGSDWRSHLQALERLYLEELMQLPDALEGLEAFLQKRAPIWCS